MKSDDQLMEGARAGRRDDFEQLVRRHLASMVRYCRRVMRDGSGEDLAQEVFIKLWDARGKYEARETFRAYLYTLATNLCRTALRSQRRSPLQLVDGAPEEVEPSSRGPAARVEAKQAAERVAAALDQVPEAQREVLVLRLQEGLDYAEIAAVLGRGESTLRSQFLYGVKKLREVMGEA